MIKRVNSTGRRRVPRDRVNIEVFDGDPRTFDALVNLDGFDAPPDAEVVLEAGCAGSNTIPRFERGTVGQLAPCEDRRLKGLKGENVFFALKIIDRSEQVGRILGLAENIRPVKSGEKTATGRQGILPIEADDLGSESWRLDFRSEDVYLLVNEKVPDLKERVRYDPLVFSLVYPPVIRQVLQRALQEQIDDDDGEHWASRWLSFAKNLHPENVPAPSSEEADEELDEWVTEVVDAFSKNHDLIGKFNKRSAEINWENTI